MDDRMVEDAVEMVVDDRLRTIQAEDVSFIRNKKKVSHFMLKVMENFC